MLYVMYRIFFYGEKEDGHQYRRNASGKIGYSPGESDRGEFVDGGDGVSGVACSYSVGAAFSVSAEGWEKWSVESGAADRPQGEQQKSGMEQCENGF